MIQKTGAWRYAEDPSTDVLCMAWAIDQGPINVWIPGQPCPFSPQLLREHEIEAHNAAFERAIWKHVMVKKYKWPQFSPDRWRCSAALALYHSLPRSLEYLGAALNTQHKKDLSGKRVMMKLSRPRADYGNGIADMWNNSDADFKLLVQYCKDDVAAERDIHARLRALPASELNIWQLDQIINERGIRVDLPAVKNALAIVSEHQKKLMERFKQITGVDSPTMVAQFKNWLLDNYVAVTDLNKNSITTLLSGDLAPDVREALEIRQSMSKTSTAKYQAIVESVCSDDKLRGLLLYHGASTGRWAGQLVQPQNFPRNNFKGDLEKYFTFLKKADLATYELCYPVMETLSSTVRGVFMPSEGHTFFGGDYNAIEARVLFWLANESRGLQMFREGEDIYKDMATAIYDCKFEDVTKEQRELGKRGVLGCLAENTIVYSDSGIKYIQEVKPNDKLWDGEKWVEHAGLLKAGLKRVMHIKCLNIELTPDHLILTKDGWQTAEEIVLFGGTPLPKSGAFLDASKLLEASSTSVQNAVSLFAANANLKRALDPTSYGVDKLRHALNVLNLETDSSEETRNEIPILFVIRALEDVGSPLSTMLKNAAKSLLTKTFRGMVLEAFESTLNPVESSWNTLLRSLVGTTGDLRSIELIIPTDIKAVIYDWSLRRKTIETKVKECYDILDSGPDNRFQAGETAIVHNCGYGMGPKKFRETCMTHARVQISEELAEKVVRAYRTKYRTVSVLWHLQELAAKQAIETKKPIRCGKVLWAVHDKFLFCRLPSGRCLAYYDPEIRPVTTSWGEEKMSITYMGTNSVSKQWERKSTFGAHLVENLSQAVARDVMAHAMLNCELQGYKVLLTVHDELLTEKVVGDKKELEKIMVQLPEWAAGLPVKAEGWSGKRYLK